MPTTRPLARALAAPLALTAALAPGAHAQSAAPILLVANEGNLEGSLSSMRVNPDGTLTLLDRVVTGTRPTTSQACPGCNTYAVSLSPSGRWAATSHAAGGGGEQITIYEIFEDGTLEIADTLTLVEGGLDIQWLRDDLLAAPVTSGSFTNTVTLYEWDESARNLTFENASLAGSFLTSVALHPSGQWLYTNDSFARLVRVFRVNTNFLSLVQTLNMPLYGTSLEITPDGRFLYAAGGISAGGNAFAGYAINELDGTLSALPGSPFTSPGASPKGFAITPDGLHLFVSHGTDATIRGFSIDPESGIPTDTGNAFDVGLQGTLQGMATLPGLLFACDDTSISDGLTGVYAFTINPDTGAFTPVPTTPALTGGIAPNDIAAWPGACRADLNADGVLNFDDIDAFVAAYLASDLAADCDGSGALNTDDVDCFASAFLAGCG